MAFFALQHQILFHDTMAYGTNHHQTTIKLQNICRESLLFGTSTANGETWEDQLKHSLMLTREAYSLNLGQAQLGQRVAVLMTYEAPSRSTVRLCFRIILEDGSPVAAGYQTMILMDQQGKGMIPAPPLITQYLDHTLPNNLLEPMGNPNFKELVHQGGTSVKKLFSKEVQEIGKQIACSQSIGNHGCIIDLNQNIYPITPVQSVPDFPELDNKIIFTFPGQGSFDLKVLRDLYQNFPETHQHFKATEAVVRKNWGASFLSILNSPEKDALEKMPDFDQVGIYLTNVLVAKCLQQRGLQPALLLGHSFGEIAALTIAGVIDLEQGVDLVLNRVNALRQIKSKGKMAAVSGPPEVILPLIKHSNIEISVVNHPRQTVLSGSLNDLQNLQEQLLAKGISLTVLKSNFPFHSSHLLSAVKPFLNYLKTCSFQSPEIPVYIGTEKRLYHTDQSLPRVLAEQFVKPFDFTHTLKQLQWSESPIFVECGAGDMISKIIRKNLDQNEKVHIYAAVSAPNNLISEMEAVIKKVNSLRGQSPKKPAISISNKTIRNDQKEVCHQIPIAIVGMGCVLPGASNPKEYWQNIYDSVSGVVDLEEIDPVSSRDFLGGSLETGQHIVADKTYTLLNGSILDIRYEKKLLKSFLTELEFDQLTKAQKILALALGQSVFKKETLLKELKSRQVQCILGSTADGSKEYDEALLLDGLAEEVTELEGENDMEPAEFINLLQQVLNYQVGDADKLEQQKQYKRIIDGFLGQSIRTFCVDSACSSSLYSVDLGIKALRSSESDLVIVGGVFAPGPANNTLFAQFRGLTPTQSCPFDEKADGVVFGDGAGILILKRLPDALSHKDKVYGVIRGIGLSSDGKSPSINVPRKKGQILALERAYESSGISPDTIQYMEAHATSTPVGDEVEFNSLQHVFKDRNPDLPKVALGSIKALIGHTGWASGVASIIKICKAFEKSCIPRQANYQRPNKNADIENSAFFIPLQHEPWPENINNLPYRAGINGFGFGGTNAHFIIESFKEAYHSRVCENNRFADAKNTTLAVVGVGMSFPGPNGEPQHILPKHLQFKRDEMPLPAKKILMPDVTENMDKTQFLTALAAEALFKQLPKNWQEWRAEIGVVIGCLAKTESGKNINKRIFLDFISRKFFQYLEKEKAGSTSIKKTVAKSYFKKLVQRINQVYPPSGPYSLPGLMPNIAAGRVAGLYDLQGPNMVIDMGANSFFQSLWAARHLLLNEDCKLVLAGGVNAFPTKHEKGGEGAMVFGLTTLATAQKEGLEVISLLDVQTVENTIHFQESPSGNGTKPNYRGLNGGLEVFHLLEKIKNQRSRQQIIELLKGSTSYFGWLFSPLESSQNGKPKNGILSNGLSESNVYAYVQGTPIEYYSPCLIPIEKTTKSQNLQKRSILFVTDQKDQWAKWGKELDAAAYKYQVICPESYQIKDALEVQLQSNGELEESAKAVLEANNFDLIVCIKKTGSDTDNHYFPQNRKLLNLLFAISKWRYDQIAKGETEIAFICLDALDDNKPLPETGLYAGFIKSLARELPESKSIFLGMPESSLAVALDRLVGALSEEKKHSEFYYAADQRYVYGLNPLNALSSDKPLLSKDSVVLATGGGRGVTAVLVEEVLRKVGCTVIAVGRTVQEELPEALQEMDAVSLKAYEAEFYQNALLQKPKASILELKQQFKALEKSQELNASIKRLQQQPGQFIYKSVDITNEKEVQRFLKDIYKTFGRVDMVIHGAGVQKSSSLKKKTFFDFSRIIDTKVKALEYLYNGIQQYGKNRSVHYHILTSAFSFLGNDGQQDYGAANEYLNRLADHLNLKNKNYWSSMAWLGWAGIGMTRGSEFASLAARRRLRGVTETEGQQIFGQLLDGVPNTPITILLAEGERNYYAPPISVPQDTSSPKFQGTKTSNTNRPSSICQEKTISLKNAPFLLDHQVDGTATLPAAFITSLVAEAAVSLRPKLKIKAFHDTYFHRFVKLFGDKPVELRLDATIETETAEQTRVKIRVLSDFVHKSGLVLQKDILHNETTVILAAGIQEGESRLLESKFKGQKLPDPYTLEGARVQLKQVFDSIKLLKINQSERFARFKLNKTAYPAAEFNYMLPNLVMVDAFWRFGTVQLSAKNKLSVYVPERCGEMQVFFDFTDFESAFLTKKLYFVGSNPRTDGDLLHVGPIEVLDAKGNLLLRVTDGLCRKFNDVDLKY